MMTKTPVSDEKCSKAARAEPQLLTMKKIRQNSQNFSIKNYRRCPESMKVTCSNKPSLVWIETSVFFTMLLIYSFLMQLNFSFMIDFFANFLANSW